MPILSLLIGLPILGGIATAMLSNNESATRAKWIGLITMLVSLLLCIPLMTHFNSQTSAMQFTESLAWLPQFGINYNLGVDGISMPLIVLTTFTTLVVLLATWNSIEHKVAQYVTAFLVMQGLMVGVFASLNAITFYVFFEATLIPMYLIIGIWGSDNRVYAAIKFFLFTFVGSVLMLAALLYLGFKAGSFDIAQLYAVKLTYPAQILIFIAFFFGFAIKIPMWPVHTWLPDAHTEAPAGGSVILAAILLKLGGYGFIRFTLPIVPDASAHLSWLMISLSLIAIVYIGFVAIVQQDMKKLVAYSSISHMGFVTLGIFSSYLIYKNTGNFNAAGLAFQGAYIVMISHAFISGALFAGIGFIYDRMHTRNIGDYGGVVNTMPLFASFFMFFAMANAGLPGTSGFVGEFMVILGTIKANFWISFLAASTLILGATYTLWMYKRVFMGKVSNDKVAALKDIAGVEVLAFSLLALMVLAIGLYPQPLIKVVNHSAAHLLSLSHISKI